ncbi:hypothetical protein HYV50_01520 [Candidatus Pacearchaeota archaeon]|nr:hypothetical protein [Candidatus Pacearchaeota archaeon]
MPEKKEEKEKTPFRTIFLIIILIIIFVFGYIYFFNKPKSLNNAQQVALRTITNPVANLDDSQAIALFNETFVIYLLYNIKANKLHNPPFSENTPKIEMKIDEDIFNAEVKDGRIYVRKGQIQNEDILLTTSKAEAVKMLRNKDYVAESFNDGNSGITLISSKTELFSKGYLSIYNELSGE